MSSKSVIRHKNQLLEFFHQSGKPREKWKIGTEHEQFIFQLPELRRAPYAGQRGISGLLHKFIADGWQAEHEHVDIVALRYNGASITLEPGGQFELSGAPLKSLHDNYNEMFVYRNQLYHYCRELGLSVLGHGIDPKTIPEDMPWMPKDRYRIMRDYMPLVGSMGLNMMTDTATVQVNLDYHDEPDFAKKMRVSMALQPFATALFANSPIHQGNLTDYKSYRAHIWTKTDPARCGLLRMTFEDDFSFEKYLEYVLDIPMYFLIRDHRYINHAGHSFRDFLAGKLPLLEGEYPQLSDFQDQLSIAFPEVRLKSYLEMRGADGGSLEHNMALCAFWVGLLYDPGTLDEVFAYVKSWEYEEVRVFLAEATQKGLEAELRGQSVIKTMQDIIAFAKQGLNRRNLISSTGEDESCYLDYIYGLLDDKRCPADYLIETFTRDCNQDVDRFLLRNLKREARALPLK